MALVGAVVVLTSAYAATPTSLIRSLAGAEVDWSAGTVTASAGAAADMRMPSPAAARPGAERRARAAAVEKLRAALRALPVRGKQRLEEKQVEVALGHASTTRTEYQSNGGVVLWVGVKFEELLESSSTAATTTTTPTIPLALAVGAMPLELAPLLVSGGKEIVARHARYHQGPPPAGAISVRRDDQGRLLLSQSSESTLDQLAGGPVVIYLQKILP
ncbi:MAG TPA: hypothetical protein VJ860_13005 [Polyangia bacterium]|nr:hypothetical protein [Polyangia bacterium]